MNKAYRSEPYVVIPGFFDIVHVHNPGAAFGIMKGQMFIFAIFTIIAMVFVYYTLKELEDENRRLKQMYADLSLDHKILKDIVEKKL